MVDLVYFKKKWFNNIVSNQFKSRVPKMMHHVFFPSGEEIIHHDHAVASLDQTVHKMRPDESSPPSHHDPEPFPLQPKWDLAAGVHYTVDLEAGSVFVRRRIGPPGKFGGDRVVSDPGRRIGRGEEGEDESGDGNADEDENEALFTKHVANRTGDGQPWFWGFWGICVRRRLGLVVSSEY